MADVEKVKELRKRTAAGIMDCRKALAYAEGDIDKAEKIIWQKRQRDGLWLSDRPAGRAGVIHSYIHHGSRIGVMVEVLCETDFAARTDEFQAFAHDLAMHIAAERPEWVRTSDISPSEFVGMEKDGLDRRCLLTQSHIKDQMRTVGELLDELSAKIGEKCSIGRFERWEVGDRKPAIKRSCRSVMPAGWNGHTSGARLFILIFLILTAIGAVVLNVLL